MKEIISLSLLVLISFHHFIHRKILRIRQTPKTKQHSTFLKSLHGQKLAIEFKVFKNSKMDPINQIQRKQRKLQTNTAENHLIR